MPKYKHLDGTRFKATISEIEDALEMYAKAQAPIMGYDPIPVCQFNCQYYVQGVINPISGSEDEAQKKKATDLGFLEVNKVDPNQDKPVEVFSFGFESTRNFWEEFTDFLRNDFLEIFILRESPYDIFEDDETQSEEKELWDQIPPYLWDRVALKMWCDGFTLKEIATKLNVSTGRVANRLSELRRRYGKNVVPYRRNSGESPKEKT
jgi:hypothetical protein